MKLSEKKQEALYKAIYDPVVDLRIKHKFPSTLDYEVAQLVHKIWRKIFDVLKLEGNP